MCIRDSIIAIPTPNLKYPIELFPIPKNDININPKVLTVEPPIVAKTLGITDILSLSEESLVNDGIIDQYGISVSYTHLPIYKTRKSFFF